MASDAFALNGAIAEILKYSLLRRYPAARTLEIHRLVQTVLKGGMDEATQRLWAERAVRAVGRAFPSPEFSNWSFCERLLSQAYACAALISQWGFEFPEAAELLSKYGIYLCGREQYIAAESIFQRVLVMEEKALGPEHPDVAGCLHSLAEVYRDQGQYVKAEPAFWSGAGHLGKNPRAGAPQHSQQSNRSGCALLHPRPICESRAALPAVLGDPGKDPGPGAPSRSSEP